MSNVTQANENILINLTAEASGVNLQFFSIEPAAPLRITLKRGDAVLLDDAVTADPEKRQSHFREDSGRQQRRTGPADDQDRGRQRVDRGRDNAEMNYRRPRTIGLAEGQTGVKAKPHHSDVDVVRGCAVTITTPDMTSAAPSDCNRVILSSSPRFPATTVAIGPNALIIATLLAPMRRRASAIMKIGMTVLKTDIATASI